MTIYELYKKASKRDPKNALAVWGRYLGDDISHQKAWFLLKRMVAE